MFTPPKCIRLDNTKASKQHAEVMTALISLLGIQRHCQWPFTVTGEWEGLVMSVPLSSLIDIDCCMVS